MSDSGLYSDPEIYDILHWPGTVQDVRGLAKIATRWVAPGATRASPRPPSLWLEPACGTGRFLIEAARQAREHDIDRRAIGFDLSPAMIEYARAKAHALGVHDASRFFTGDMRRFAHELEPQSVSLAFNPINTIRHLMSDSAMLEHLEEIAKVLAPGGVYAVGLSVCDPGSELPTEDVWEGRRTHADGTTTRVKQVVQYEPPGWLAEVEMKRRSPARRERVSSHLMITRTPPSGPSRRRAAGLARPSKGPPEHVDHRDDAYWLRTYTRAQWATLVERSALRLIASVDEVGTPHDPGLSGYALWLLGRR
jgi:SAM-dependent methyltransferase